MLQRVTPPSLGGVPGGSCRGFRLVESNGVAFTNTTGGGQSGQSGWESMRWVCGGGWGTQNLGTLGGTVGKDGFSMRRAANWKRAEACGPGDNSGLLGLLAFAQLSTSLA